MALDAHMQEALEAKEREVRQLAEGQRELEAQLHDLSSTQQKASSENQQLREVERDLAGKLEDVRGQLQVTRGRLDAARGRVSWQIEEKQSAPRAREEKASSGPRAASPQEAPLPGLFEAGDDWDQLLSDFGSPPHQAMQLTWSPPPTPRDTSGSQTPRVVRQISISSPHAELVPIGQEQASDLDGAPGSPSGVPSSIKDQIGTLEDPKEQNNSPKQPVDIPGLEARPQARFLWDLPGVPAVEWGSLQTPPLRVQLAPEARPPPQDPSLPPQASAGPSQQFQDDQGPEDPAKLPSWAETLPQEPHDIVVSDPGSGSQEIILKCLQSLESVDEEDQAGKEAHPGGLQEAHGQAPGPDGLPASTLPSPEAQLEAEEGDSADGGLQDLDTGHPDWLQQDGQPTPTQSDMSWAPVEAEIPALGKLILPSISAPTGAQPGAADGLPESTPTLPIPAELEAQPRPLSMPVQSEKEPDLLQPEEPGVDSEEAKLPSSLGDPTASKLLADPDYLFHVVFVGDSNVGKTSFLHLLHHDSFATGLTATVGVDFRVKSLLVDNRCFALQLWDTAGQERYHSLTRQLLRKAEGVVLMYDVTSRESFAHVRYWLGCLQDAGADTAVILLLGNKMDCEEERQVPTEAGRRLAQELGASFSECSAALGHNILEPMVNLARSLKTQEERLKGSLVEVTSLKPPKRYGCCS
uniref:RAB44, member RAS oncogene family n=1 Tax=Jaculus jaculus TaxID=51337 RepID=A0A8C5LB66_JACJA